MNRNMLRETTLAVVVLGAAWGATHSLTAADQAKTQTETGYVISLSENSLSISNVPLEGPAGGQAGTFTAQEKPGTGQGKTGKVATFSSPGNVTVGGAEDAKKLEEAKKAGAKTEAGTIVLSREQMEKLRQQKGAGKTGDSVEKKKAEEGKKLAFTRFVVNQQTRMKGDFSRGTKVKVTYRTQGDQKIATHIELVKEDSPPRSQQ